MKLQRVVITGRGTINPLGHNQKSTWEAIIAGTNGVGPITRFDSNRIKTHFAAEVKDFDAVEQFGLREARRMDRFCHFALAATEEAIADSKLVISPSNNDTIGVVLGSGIGGIGTLLAEAEKVREQGIHRTSPHLVP
nr:beta-ketoacyl-[acyl-carrier-protein] synthase II [Anaerolineae bacterium]